MLNLNCSEKIGHKSRLFLPKNEFISFINKEIQKTKIKGKLKQYYPQCSNKETGIFFFHFSFSLFFLNPNKENPGKCTKELTGRVKEVEKNYKDYSFKLHKIT